MEYNRIHTHTRFSGVVWCCLPARSTHSITMSLEATRDLSIPDLIRVLNEKIGLEFTMLRNTSLPPAVSARSLESEVSGP